MERKFSGAQFPHHRDFKRDYPPVKMMHKKRKVSKQIPTPPSHAIPRCLHADFQAKGTETPRKVTSLNFPIVVVELNNI